MECLKWPYLFIVVTSLSWSGATANTLGRGSYKQFPDLDIVYKLYDMKLVYIICRLQN